MGSFLRLGVLLIAATAVTRGGLAKAESPSSVAVVSEQLTRSEAYTLYAKTLVQIDLLANPNTAYLPITVSTLRPGQILIDGSAPTARMRDFVLDSARRISGLSVDGNIEITEVKPDLPSSLSAEEFEAEIQATISGFFPEYVGRIRTTVKQGGVVELNGEVPSYESKLNISRIVKSIPGCKSVVNLLRIPVEPESGLVHVTEDGQLRLEASQLPIIPAAPVMLSSEIDRDHPRLRSMSMPLADDAPGRGFLGAQFVEDAKSVISRDPRLTSLDLTVESEGGGVEVSGRVEKQADVEYILDTLAEIPDVKKVVVKSRPISMMRTYPTKPKSVEDTKDQSWAERLKDAMPWGGDDADDPVRMSHGFWFRSTVQKTLGKKCSSRISGLKVKSIPRGLLIEGEVSSSRDRAFVLKQVDSITELSVVPVDVVLRIQE